MFRQHKARIQRLLLAALSLGAVVLLLVQTARLNRCDGLLALQWQAGTSGADTIEAQLETNTLILASSVFRRGTVNASTDTNRSIGCTAYLTDIAFARTANLPMASGRYFLPTDHVEERLTVLGYDAAVALFSGKDCLGAQVILDGAAYTVIGVAAERPAGIETLARTEQAAVYLLDDSPRSGLTYAYVRTISVAADLLAHSLSAEANETNQLAVHNLSQAAGLTRTVGHLFVIVWLFIIGYHTAKALSQRFQYPADNTSRKPYYKQRHRFRVLERWANATINDRRRILFWCVLFLSTGLIYCIGAAALRFRLVIPGGWLTGGGLVQYFINRNANPAPALYLAQLSGYALAAVISLGLLTVILLDKALAARHDT